MPNTYTQLVVHMVFSTKYRQATLPRQVRGETYRYISGIIRNLGGKLIVGNGSHDHAHLLSYYPARLSVSDFARKVKTNSSRWLGESRHALLFNGWQVGYCGLSVSPNDIDRVRRYIENQEAHHKTTSFEEELRGLLDEAGVEYEEEYLLD